MAGCGLAARSTAAYGDGFEVYLGFILFTGPLSPSLPFLLLSLLSPFLSFPAAPFPYLSLAVGPSNTAKGVLRFLLKGLGSAVSSPSEIWGVVSTEIEFDAFYLKM